MKTFQRATFIEMLFGGHHPAGVASKVAQLIIRMRCYHAEAANPHQLAVKPLVERINRELRAACFRAKKICLRSNGRPDFGMKYKQYANLQGTAGYAARTSM